MVRLFEGYEAEGCFQGLWTLFVSGDVPVKKLFEVYDGRKHRQIYFGADRLSFVNWDTVLHCIVAKLKAIITVETSQPVPTGVLGDIYIVFKINGLNEEQISQVLEKVPNEKLQVKFDSLHYSYLIPVHKLYSNMRSDIFTDRELWKNETAS